MDAKLNLGCGTDVRAGYVNLDAATAPGVDIVHDLTRFPWPLDDNVFDEILAMDLLEHLPDFIRTMEEIWRIGRNDAVLDLRVPYWNSHWAWCDPQHVKAFHQDTFNFFDPSKEYCQQRPYYSKARFHIEYVVFEGCWLRNGWNWTWKVERNETKRILTLASKLCDVLHFMRVRMRTIKP